MTEIKPMSYQTIDRSIFDTLSPWKDMRRCLLRDDGKVNYYLDANDSTKKEDGTAAVLTGADGQVMVEIPKFWWKWEVGTVNGKRTFRWFISDVAEDGFEVHPAFYRDRDGDGVAEEVDKRYFSAYLGNYNINSTISYMSSVRNTRPIASRAITEFRTKAQARGNGWGLIDYHLLHAVQLLFLLEFGDFNARAKIGRGYVDGNTISAITGSTSQYGNQSFGETTGKQQMSYRGIEDFYGNCSYFIDGICVKSNVIAVGNVSFNNNAEGYSILNDSLNNGGGFIDDFNNNLDFGFIPSKFVNVTSIGKINDRYIRNSSSVFMGMALGRDWFGNTWESGDYIGMFSLCAYQFSVTSPNLTSRITY
ncbi:hypothetical protein EBB07_29635 [Paenibacillaceae bacterium]|nr:hypothetical protein EBB07_29635 [Paenibacillaceae bacterium]